jgi:hypothetical protein
MISVGKKSRQEVMFYHRLQSLPAKRAGNVRIYEIGRIRREVINLGIRAGCCGGSPCANRVGEPANPQLANPDHLLFWAYCSREHNLKPWIRLEKEF